VDPDRRARLLGVALRALVRDRTGTEPAAEVGSMGRGVALVHDSCAWVLVDERHETSLGPAIAWALRRGATSLQLLTPEGAGVLARRAEGLRPERLAVEVWHVNDRHQTRAVAEPLPAPIEPLPEHMALAATIAAAGAEVVIEHGVVAGEVAGLEVCRVVTDPFTDAVRLEVGVGVHDREAFTMLHGDVPVTLALADVVSTVAQHRGVGAEPHPLNRLAAERLLRHRLVAAPHRIGLQELVAVAPPVPRRNLKDPVPCVAQGRDAQGRPVIVVCSHGIDLDVVPYALDARRALDPTATVVIAVDGRDAHPVQHRLAELASGDVRVVPVAAQA
jgi:hypothetical protein